MISKLKHGPLIGFYYLRGAWPMVARCLCMVLAHVLNQYEISCPCNPILITYQ